MRGPRSLIRRQSLRVRITLSFVTAAAALIAVLSSATYLSVRTVLDNNRVSSSTRQTIFAVLFAREFLASRPARPQQLVSLLQSRESFDSMLTEGEDWFSTALSFTPTAVPGPLRDLVARERLGYQETTIDGQRTLVFGSPLPPPGTDLYLSYSLSDIDRTLSLLARVLLIAGLAVVAAAAALAQVVSRRILRPLAGVSSAAQRVAEGLLETRVQASTTDELGTLAASFNQMASALQDMLQRERRFVAAVSHELRTPLAALHTTSQVLAKRRDEFPEGSREALDLMVEDVTGLSRLVEELLEISELDAQRGAVRWEPLNLASMVTAVARKRHRQVALEGPPVTTVSDKVRLERILGNLIDNAFQHGDGQAVAVRIETSDGTCLVSVADRGPGIPEQDLPHLFERFYKADRARSRDRGGIGLGLALAMQNARLLGGTIDVASNPGAGATFTLRLPLRTAPPREGSG